MRAFFAIEIPEAIREQIGTLIKNLKKLPHSGFDSQKIHWIKAAKYHLTLRFLGDVSEEQSNQLINLAKSTLNNFSSFDLILKNLKLFPNAHHPHVIALIPEPQNILMDIFHQLDCHATTIGLAKDNRPYNPHLTLAKIRTAHLTIPKSSLSLPLMAFPVQEIILYRSNIEKQDALYTPLAVFPLQI